MAEGKGRIRRWLPALLLLAMLAWIAVIVLLIAHDPTPGSGNPMD